MPIITEATFGGSAIDKSWDVTLIEDILEIVGFEEHMHNGNNLSLPKTKGFESLIDFKFENLG